MDTEPRPDDQVLPATRWTVWVVAPILVAAGVILFVFPARTGSLWAWRIGSEMTAMAIGGGYLAGAVVFVLAGTVARRWSRFVVGLAAASVLTMLLLVATVVHWENFDHDHVSFWAWLVVYAITPFWLPALVAMNSRRASRAPVEGERLVPGPVRAAVATAGAVQLVVAGVLFVRPSALVDAWPWPLTPLTARTVAAFLVFIALVLSAFVVERRWDVLELPVFGAALGLTLVGVGAIRGRDDFEGFSDPSTVVFIVALVGAVVGLTALIATMSTHRWTRQGRGAEARRSGG